MAQKKAVAAKGKNGVEKPAKRGAKAAKPQEEEEELVAAQSPSKKGKKLPVKEVPQSSEEDSDDEEQNGGEAEEDSDSQAEDAGDLIDDEAEEDEEDSDDEDDDELEPGQASFDNLQADEDDDSEDEAPVEEPVAKKGKKSEQPNAEDSNANKGGIPKIRVGKIPPGTPKNQIIHCSNLPKEFKHKDLVGLFTKFGPILILSRYVNKNGENVAIVAFEAAASAEAALAAKEKALTLDGNVVRVSHLRNKEANNDLTVVVGLFGPHVTTGDIKSHFEKIGPVESVTLSTNKTHPKAFVRFANLSDAEKSLKLHSTEFFSRFITVRPQVHRLHSIKTPETTLILENVGKHESYNSNAIEKIFKKYDVDLADVVCSKAVLAFITFKGPEGATKALAELNGKTVSNLELKLTRFQRSSSGRAILVTNLSDATEEQLREVFGQNGDIESVQMLTNRAVIKFTSDEAFCKSFLLNEYFLNNSPLFIEPNSMLKHRVFSKKRAPRGPGAAPVAKFSAKYQKFGNKPFNKRPYQENGAKPFVKRPRF